MNEERTNRDRLTFSTEGVDFDDDASIEAFAARVWHAAATAWTGDDMTVSDQPTPVVLTHRYAQALEYAAAIHGTDVRKGTPITYMCHLIGVSALVLEAGGDEIQAIAGLLHDAVEDAGGLARAADIRLRFGDEVADIVLACSDSTDAETKRTRDYWERKQQYLDHLEQKADGRAVLVSIADKVHNARALVTDLVRGLPLWKFNGTPAQVLHYYQQLARIAQSRGVPDTLTIPLDDAVRELTSTLRSFEDPR